MNYLYNFILEHREISGLQGSARHKIAPASDHVSVLTQPRPEGDFSLSLIDRTGLADL
jgi:hypothetical protein